MRKASKIMAVVLAVLTLVSVASVGVSAKMWPNAKYKTPAKTIPYLSTVPVNDGVIKAGEWGDCKIEVSQAAMQGTEGHLWSDNQAADPDGTLPMPGIPMTDAKGTAYIAWNEYNLFFALEVKTENHYNNQLKPEELWMGDCLQVQIAEKIGGVRYEFGYARNTKNNLSYSYQWFPAKVSLLNGAKNSKTKNDGKQAFYVERNNTTKTTTYEIAIPTAQFSVKKDLKLAKGSKIPFAFALHVYEKDRPTSGCFYEWAEGVVGGETEKDISKAAVLTCEQKGPTTTASTTKTTAGTTATKTTAGTTATKTTAGTTATKTTAGTTGNNKPGTTTNGNTPVTTTTTEAVQTTAPSDIVEDAKPIDPTTDYTLVEDADTLAKFDSLKEEGQDIIVNQAVAEKKFSLYKSDDLISVVAMDADGELVALSPSDEKEGYQIFDTTEMGEVTVYVVTKAPVVEPEATTTAANTEAVGTTTAADKATTTTKAAEESNGGFPWWIIIVIVAVIVIAGVVFFILKKKKDNED